MEFNVSEILISSFIGALLPVIFGGIGFYFSKRRTKQRNAKLLHHEMHTIFDALDSNLTEVEINNSTVRYANYYLPITNYEGILASGQLSYFNDVTMQQISDFYDIVVHHNKTVEKLNDLITQIQINQQETNRHYLFPYMKQLQAQEIRLLQQRSSLLDDIMKFC